MTARLFRKMRTALTILLFAMAICAGGPKIRTEAASTNDMTITAIDIGGGNNYGDSVVLTSGGRTLVMDTACEYQSSSYTISWLKNNNRKRVDLYISHYHDDHVWSMAKILKDSYFTVGTIYLPNDNYLRKGYGKNPSYMKLHMGMYNEIVSLAKQKGVKLVYLGKGSSFSYGNAKFEVLWGPGFDSDARYGTNYVNNNSMVTRVSCGGVRYLTCGDLENAGEGQVLASGVDLKADIYKASHHGASNANSASFVSRVQPSWSFWNCTDETTGALGNVGWISETYALLRQYGNCLGVRYNGTLTFSVKDGKIRVSGQRNMVSQTFSLGNQNITLQRSNGCPWKLTDRIKEMEFESGTWIQDSNGWRFKFASGEFATNTVVYSVGQGYYMDSDGYMIKGWYTAEDGSKYFGDSSGALFAGWKKIQDKWYYFDVSTYKMVTRWLKLDNNWYYFDAEGKMMTGWQKIGDYWYHLRTSGEMDTGVKMLGSLPYNFGTGGYVKAGWVSYGGKWYYVNSDASHVSGRQQIAGKWYYFDPASHIMKGNGWFKVGEDWYYATASGELKSGWMNKDRQWYYFEENIAVRNRIVQIGKTKYGFAPSCAMYHSGWFKVGDEWAYANADGTLKSGWMQKDRNWYFFKDNIAVTGVVKIGNYWYQFGDSSCAMFTHGWVKEDGKWYYATSGGQLQTGWVTLNKEKYYFDEEAVCAFGKAKIDDAYYYFDRKSGAQVVSGWIEDEYEVEDEEGVKKIVKETLYACEAAAGQLAVGRTEIEGEIYYFNEDGVLLKNVEVDGGFADEKGIWKEVDHESEQEVNKEVNKEVEEPKKAEVTDNSENEMNQPTVNEELNDVKEPEQASGDDVVVDDGNSSNLRESEDVDVPRNGENLQGEDSLETDVQDFS